MASELREMMESGITLSELLEMAEATEEELRD